MNMLASLRLKETYKVCLVPLQCSVFSWKKILVHFSIELKRPGLKKKHTCLQNLFILCVIKHYLYSLCSVPHCTPDYQSWCFLNILNSKMIGCWNIKWARNENLTMLPCCKIRWSECYFGQSLLHSNKYFFKSSVVVFCSSLKQYFG